MKKGSLKSYIILFVIVGVTLVIIFYLLNWYKQYNDIKLSEAVISNTIKEVKYDGFDTVIKERDLIIVYTCTASESKCRKFEEKFGKYINNNNLNEEIIYFDIENKDNLKNIYEKYKHKDLRKKLGDYPMLFVFSEGKIIDLLSTKDGKLSISKVDDFLDGYDL